MAYLRRKHLSDMEILTLEHDITVFYVTAASFPDGALAAHQQLHSLVPYTTKRRYFGISRPENGPIVYRAAAEELSDGEAKRLGCPTLVLKKGRYVTDTVKNYKKNLSQMETTFGLLLQHPEIDPYGYCVEWYISDDDVKCMVRLA